jgi:hypothetical protein
MTRSSQFSAFIKRLTRTSLSWLLPRFAKLDAEAWDDALQRAREMPFDRFEQVGVLTAVAFTTYLLGFDANEGGLSPASRYLAQFLAALALLVLLAGPLYLRCLGRGLKQEIARLSLARFNDGGSHHDQQHPCSQSPHQ